MEFKTGDRVHVTKFYYGDVDFYATLKEEEAEPYVFILSNCTEKQYENEWVWVSGESDFGSEDYYILATEEDSE